MAYKAKHHEPTNGDYIDYDKVRLLAEKGCTNAEIADFLDISVRTLYRKQAIDDKFAKALKGWKKDSDNRVERTLFESACGYEYLEVKEVVDANGNVTETVRTRKFQPANTTAMLYWLKNRKPKQWNERRDGLEPENDNKPIKEVVIRVVQGKDE